MQGISLFQRLTSDLPSHSTITFGEEEKEKIVCKHIDQMMAGSFAVRQSKTILARSGEAGKGHFWIDIRTEISAGWQDDGMYRRQ
jgi:hypothetical protein